MQLDDLEDALSRLHLDRRFPACHRLSLSGRQRHRRGGGLWLEWTTDCWQGRVSNVIAELTAWLAEQEPVADEAERAEDDPRTVVAKSLTYLTNNQPRMHYPEYRQQGLPVTSSLMESFVREMNWRVKGTEKFWNDPSGANPILALRAASLCDDSRIDAFLRK